MIIALQMLPEEQAQSTDFGPAIVTCSTTTTSGYETRQPCGCIVPPHHPTR
jgi:hypothetical protein